LLLMTSPVMPTWSPRSTSDFHCGQPLLADAGQADHHLQRRLALLQGGEAELAADPREHHAAGDADGLARLLAGLEVAEALADVGQAGRAGVAEGVRRSARGHQPVVLLAADPHLLGEVSGNGVIGHGPG
jgi:hypothetical protein